jgi:type I restriction enzyme S subunit
VSTPSKEPGLPDGWRSLPLRDVASEKIVYGIVQAGPHDPNGVPYLKSSDVGGVIAPEGLQRTSLAIHAKFGRSKVVPGNIVISLRGNTGATSVVPPDLREANLTQGTARIAVSKEHSSEFVRQQIAGASTQRLIQAATKGSTFVEITLDDLRKVEILCPPPHEQRRIAEILSTWDRTIETVEALITNAREQKAALMQALLTGKRRLPGFKEGWATTSLGQLGTSFGGLSGKTGADFGTGAPFITYKNVFENAAVDPRNVELVELGEGERQNSIRFGDILFTTSSETPDEVGMSSVVLFDHGTMYLNSFCFGFRPNDAHEIVPAFAAHFFRSDEMRTKIAALAQGSTRYNISKAQLLKVSFALPAPPEQHALAKLLDVAQAEITRQNDQLKALRQEKAALMQQLLTGKRRVRVAESEAA